MDWDTFLKHCFNLVNRILSFILRIKQQISCYRINRHAPTEASKNPKPRSLDWAELTL